MTVEFHDVLARKGLGTAEKDGEPVVLEGAAVDLPRVHAVGLELAPARHFTGDLEGILPADADDRDAAFSYGRCDCSDAFHLRSVIS